tara:strand:- start:3350 stop:4405 length:1056 start_codon:yes stop_codon:yes gene_type:complete
MSKHDLTIQVGDSIVVFDLSEYPEEDKPVIQEQIVNFVERVELAGGAASVVRGGSSGVMDPAAFSGLGLGWATASSNNLGPLDDWFANQSIETGFELSQNARVASRDAAAAAAAIAAQNKRYNDAISAFDRQVVLENRKFEAEAERLSNIAAQTKSQYDIQAAQRAIATAERNKDEQAANFGLQMDSFDNTQGDFFRNTSTAADPSRAARAAYVGNESPLAQYAQRVQDLSIASNQEKLDVQEGRIAESNRQAQFAISDRLVAAQDDVAEAAKKENDRLLARINVVQSRNYNNSSSDQRAESTTRFLAGDSGWEGSLEGGTYSQEVGQMSQVESAAIAASLAAANGTDVSA